MYIKYPTAARLNLHRNTLTYRLARIRQLLTCSLDDADTRLHLMLSFRFLKSDVTSVPSGSV